MVFGQKKWVKIIIAPLFQLKFDDVTDIVFDCIVTNRFSQTHLILFYLTPKFVEI